MSDVRVSGLTIYPVKSCAGIDVDAVTVTETGFMYDRAWMLVESRKPKARRSEEEARVSSESAETDGGTPPAPPPAPKKRRAKPRASVFVTQRTEPKLALVRVKLPSEVLSPSWDGILPPDAAMTITAPGMPQALEVPLAPASPLPRCKVGVWEWEGLAGDEGSEASEWFTRYLGKTESVIRLVRWLGDGALPPAVAAPSRRTASIHDLATLEHKARTRRASDPSRRARRYVLAGAMGAGAAVGSALLARAAAAPAPSLAATALTAALVETTWSFLSRWRRLTSKPRRRVDHEFAPNIYQSGSAFSDGYPILLASDASLRELNERLATPVPMTRFRPNVTVDGPLIEPFAEDGWGSVVFGGVKSVVTTPRVYKESKTRGDDDDFDVEPGASVHLAAVPTSVVDDDEARDRASPGWEKKLGVEVRKRRSVRIKTGVEADLVKPCSRCVMTTVDQSTGVRGGPEADPLRTLYAIRSGRECGFSTDTYKPEWSDEVFFGWNLCCNAKPGSKIRVGDVVTVIKRRDFVKARE